MSQPSLNPFHPAEAVVPKIKALVFGAPGVGKTYLALTSPGRIAIIDTEGGTAFYARRAGTHGLSHFDVLPTKTYRDVQAAVEYIAANPGIYETLVIDPVTVIYEVLQDAALIKRAEVNRRKNRGGDAEDTDLEMLDWGRIKRAYKALMTELGNLPVHVIVTAREKAEQERHGTEVVTIGQKADAEKTTGYYFDTVLRMVPTATGREAIILKDRTGIHALNAHVQEPTFDSLFGAVIKSGKGATAPRAIPSDEKAAETDAATTLSAPWTGARIRTEAVKAGLVKATVEASYSAIAAGRTPDLLSADEWRRIAIDLHLAEPAPTDEFTAEDVTEALAEATKEAVA
jgi:hypothetical protein